MTARLIDGRLEAQRLCGVVRKNAAAFAQEEGAPPGLAVVLVGGDPASEIYVRNKVRVAGECGVRSEERRLPASVSQSALLELLREFNERADIHGVLVQLPLPPHISTEAVLRAIDPAKDVDGFHPHNAGLLAVGQPALVPCTPLGCLRLAQTVRPELRGLNVLVVGASNIVGRPAAQLFLLQDCTISVAHRHSRDIARLCREADVAIIAAGCPGLVKGDWIKPGAVVIDVGINRIPAADGGFRLVGDVDFEAARQVAGAITPVPGGVGPMTVAMLMANTLTCARLQRQLGGSQPWLTIA